ncbi:MAG: cation diffusion facilitator family transporter [Acidobacteriaceae bacterium]
MHLHGPATDRTKRILRISLVLTFGYILLTFFVGLRAHSLALLSEAGHNTSDFLALLMSFVAVYFHARPATDKKTFGYRRAGVLAAFINALALIGIACWLFVEAIGRLLHPLAVEPRLMMGTAAVGVLMNGVLAWMLFRVADDVNIRGAFLHMLGDTLSTAAVIVGGFVIAWTGMQWVDPVLSLIIAGIIFWSSLSIVRETLNVLLEGTPENISITDIRCAMQAVSGVCGVHDLHVWSLGSHLNALASHVTISDIPPSESRRILADLNHQLREHFQIHHTTIQFEKRDEAGCEVEDGCLPVGEALAETHAHSHEHSH